LISFASTLALFAFKMAAVHDSRQATNATVGDSGKTMTQFGSATPLVVNQNGWNLDDAARHLWELGYFPESVERPDIKTLLDAIADEAAGRPRYHPDNAYAQDFTARISDMADKIERRGINLRRMSNREVEAALFDRPAAEGGVSSEGEAYSAAGYGDLSGRRGASGAVPAAPPADEAPARPAAPLTPNYDAGAAGRYRAAADATRERVGKFNTGPVDQALRTRGGPTDYRVEDRDAPRWREIVRLSAVRSNRLRCAGKEKPHRGGRSRRGAVVI
jgi:hypothetical protein